MNYSAFLGVLALISLTFLTGGFNQASENEAPPPTGVITSAALRSDSAATEVSSTSAGPGNEIEQETATGGEAARKSDELDGS